MGNLDVEEHHAPAQRVCDAGRALCVRVTAGTEALRDGGSWRADQLAEVAFVRLLEPMVCVPVSSAVRPC
jgi:hypothetical protein